MNFPESLNTDYTSLNITLIAASHVIPLRGLYLPEEEMVTLCFVSDNCTYGIEKLCDMIILRLGDLSKL